MGKSPEMNRTIYEMFGDNGKLAGHEQRCSKVFCGKPLSQCSPFRTPLDKKEYGISGMCQDCSDAFFGGEEPE